jgi:hypothetical protein
MVPDGLQQQSIAMPREPNSYPPAHSALIDASPQGAQAQTRVLMGKAERPGQGFNTLMTSGLIGH